MKYIRDLINNSMMTSKRKREPVPNGQAKIDLSSAKEIIAALDTHYSPICTEGFDSSKDDFSEINNAIAGWPLLLDALVKIGAPAMTELESALHHPNINVRVSSMSAIGRISCSNAVDLLLPFLDSANDFERQCAVGALGYTHSPRAIERIINALDDKNVYVRESAIEALGECGDASVLPKLEQIAKSDKTLVENYGKTIGTVASENINKIRKRGK